MPIFIWPNVDMQIIKIKKQKESYQSTFCNTHFVMFTKTSS
jgi:hypothetical protein